MENKEQNVEVDKAWVKANKAQEAAERAMAVERAAAGRVIAMGQVADVVRIGEEAAYAEARAKVDEAQAAWTSWAMYEVARAKKSSSKTQNPIY
jgi:hypothetical protein